MRQRLFRGGSEPSCSGGNTSGSARWRLRLKQNGEVEFLLSPVFVLPVASGLNFFSVTSGILARKKYVRLRQSTAAIKIQAYVRRWLCQINLQKEKRAAVRIQSATRAHFARSEFAKLRRKEAAINIQVRNGT